MVVGSRDGHDFDLPTPTHGAVEGPVEPYTTAWDAIGDLENDDDPELQVRGIWIACQRPVSAC